MGEHWTEANELFKRLGDKADPEMFGTEAIMKQSQKEAAEHAGKDTAAKP